MDTNYYKSLEPFFGAWNITRLIGEGSFGKVFEIEREDFGRTYKAALKAITIPQSESEVKSVLADGMDMQSATTYYKGFVEEVVDEFALMAQLKGNSNIVSYEDHAVIEHKDGIGWDILIRMELLTPLLDYTTEKQMSQDDILKLGIDICRALEYCKNFNIIHRDIKPENIFISPSGDYKLGDFGIARTAEKTTNGMSKKGTYTYMAPEVYKGETYGPSVDIYSLGIVLYRLVNGNRAPFLPAFPAPISHSDRENSIARRIGGEKIPVPMIGEGKLSEIILKACAYAPQERYSSPEEMRRDLESVLSSHPDAAFTVNLTANHVTEKTAQNPALAGESVQERPAETVSQMTQQLQWGTQPQQSAQTAQPQWDTQAPQGVQQTAQPQWDAQAPQDVQQTAQPQWNAQNTQSQPDMDDDGTVFLFGDEDTHKPQPAPVRQEAPKQEPPRETVRSGQVQQEKKKGKKTPLIIGGGVVAVAVIGIALAGIENSGPNIPINSLQEVSDSEEPGNAAASDGAAEAGGEENITDMAEVSESEAGSDVPASDNGTGEPIADSEVGYFNELLFGTYKMEPVDSSAESGEIVEDAVQFEYNEYYETDFFIFPEELNGMSVNQNYSEDMISYSGENFYANTKENQPDLFADFVCAELDYNDSEAAKAFYVENMAGKVDYMELTFADRTGELYEDIAYYEITDGQLILYRPALSDETMELELQSTAYGISRENYTFQLSRDGLSAQYAPDGFGQDDGEIAKWFRGYASSPEDVYEGISYFRLSLEQESSSANAAPEINFVDGTTADSPAVTFTGDNTVTVSWESRHSMLGAAAGTMDDDAYIKEPGSVTFRYIPNPEVGFILIGNDGVHKYQKTYDQYFYDALGSNLNDSLSENGEISSVGEVGLLELLAVQNKIQAQLVEAFAAQNLNVKIENGVIALDSSILFGLDDAELSEEGKAYLDAFVDAFWSILADDSDYAGYISAVVVIGYTDSSGDDNYNLQLSEKRAQAVTDYCTEREFILSMFLRPVGAGSTDLIYSENGEEDKEASRRVEFRIVFDEHGILHGE